jgi:6-pyruvoyltetrahydropterin/6-carboxytetrahydropterin synthase
MPSQSNGAGPAPGAGERTRLAYVTRTENISCAHRLHSPYLSEDENAELYGKCNNPNGHGHNYRISATVRGPVDSRTGMVVNITDLKAAMNNVLANLDHKNLDKDVEWFMGGPLKSKASSTASATNGTHEGWVPRTSTTEMLAIYLWDSLELELEKALGTTAAHVSLFEVKIDETEKNTVVYRGETI